MAVAVITQLFSKTKLRGMGLNPTGRGGFWIGNVLDLPEHIVSSYLSHEIHMQK